MRESFSRGGGGPPPPRDTGTDAAAAGGGGFSRGGRVQQPRHLLAFAGEDPMHAPAAMPSATSADSSSATVPSPVRRMLHGLGTPLSLSPAAEAGATNGGGGGGGSGGAHGGDRRRHRRHAPPKPAG